MSNLSSDSPLASVQSSVEASFLAKLQKERAALDAQVLEVRTYVALGWCGNAFLFRPQQTLDDLSHSAKRSLDHWRFVKERALDIARRDNCPPEIYDECASYIVLCDSELGVIKQLCKNLGAKEPC